MTLEEAFKESVEQQRKMQIANLDAEIGRLTTLRRSLETGQHAPRSPLGFENERLYVTSGATRATAVQQAQMIANLTRTPVSFAFNERPLTVRPEPP